MSSSAQVHPSASLGPDVELGEGVQIGPRCTLTGQVSLGDGVQLIGDVYITGPAMIGPRTVIYPYASLGFPGQDRKFSIGDPTAGVRVGSDCILREQFTMHAATKLEAPTSMGDRCMCMVGSHFGHDSSAGDDVILVNGACLGGHSRVDDRATLSGAAMIHQFGRVGRLAFVTGVTPYSADVPPFCMTSERNRVAGINRIGMRRAGIPREEIDLVQQAFRRIFTRHMQREQMIETLSELGTGSECVAEMAEWFKGGRRSICVGPGRVPRWFAWWLHEKKHIDSDGAEGIDIEPSPLDRVL